MAAALDIEIAFLVSVRKRLTNFNDIAALDAKIADLQAQANNPRSA